MKTQLHNLVRRIANRIPEGFKRTPSIRDTFSSIYANNTWGGEAGSFFSGEGSHKEALVNPYCSMLETLAEAQGFKGTTFVDLGCGDFNIGNRLAGLSSQYIGVDVVPRLVEHLQQHYGSDRVSFTCLDITSDPLPQGDVCFLRQVFQHLCNQQILKTLPRLKQYKKIFITEHYPAPGDAIKPNRNLRHGPRIRLYDHSAVFLDQPPFSIPAEELELVQALEDDLTGIPGSIQTFCWTPGRSES